MDREEIFGRLTGILARYEPGDLVRHSEIFDVLGDLGASYTGNPAARDFLSRLLSWMKQYLQAGICLDLADSLGEALSLLQRLKPGLSAATRKQIETAMKDFPLEPPKITAPTDTHPEPENPVVAAAETVSAGNQIFHSDEILAIFRSEALERLSTAQELVLVLENQPEDGESLAALFRVFHTIKGESGFLHLGRLGELTHRLENILDHLRNQKLELNRALVDLLLAGIDRSRSLIKGLSAGREVGSDDAGLPEFMAELDRVSAQAQPSLGTVLVQTGRLREEDVSTILEKQRSGRFNQRFGEIAVKEKLISPQDLQAALGQQTISTSADELDKSQAGNLDKLQDEIIKVRLGKINFLVDMIGELTIALGQVAEDSLAMSQVKKITRSLQFGAMELRTDTMQGLFSTARRIIRDLSHNLGKQVTIKSEGERLEIDRNLIKKLEEPLMHLVRNALDHGLETGPERLAKGKPETGVITISATRHGSTIVITVEDDGAGLSKERILAKAQEYGLISRDAAATLTEAQIYDFIFQPGFSTSDRVSQVSGRGVGMDIVRSMVTASRGSIRLRTNPGLGTAIVMTFPISTAIIDGLIVRVGTNSLIVPVSSVVESLKVPKASLSWVNGSAELVTIRDKVIPVLRLEKVLGMDNKTRQDQGAGIGAGGMADGRSVAEPRGMAGYLIGLIVENGDHQPYFLVIDEVMAKKEVVVKPLGPRFRNMRGITSGTVMAGGAIGLVLDVDQVVNLAVQKDVIGPAAEESA